MEARRPPRRVPPPAVPIKHFLQLAPAFAFFLREDDNSFAPGTARSPSVDLSLPDRQLSANMPPRKAATAAPVKATEPAAKKTRTTRGGASVVAKSVPAPPADLADIAMSEEVDKHGAHDMDLDPQVYTKMNGYGGLTEEELGWAELLKQGYDEQYEKGKMHGYSNQFALSDQVKTIDVSMLSTLPSTLLTFVRKPSRTNGNYCLHTSRGKVSSSSTSTLSTIS